MNLIVFRKTKSIQDLIFSSLREIKENEFLLVSGKRLHKGLETMDIHFESSVVIGIE